MKIGLTINTHEFSNVKLYSSDLDTWEDCISEIVVLLKTNEGLRGCLNVVQCEILELEK